MRKALRFLAWGILILLTVLAQEVYALRRDNEMLAELTSRLFTQVELLEDRLEQVLLE